MRVLHLTHNYPRFTGDPSGAFIEELVRALPQDEVSAFVLCPHAKGLDEKESRNGAVICRFRYAQEDKETLAYEGKMLDALKRGGKGLRLLATFIRSFIRETRRIVEEEKIDLVHAHWLLPAGVAARIALRSSRLPLVLSSHGTDVRMLNGLPLGDQLARWVLGRVRIFLPVSGYLGTQLEQRSGMSLPKEILPMPASEMFVAPPRRTLARRVVAVGNLTPQKRFDVLIRALGKLNERGITLELTLVGDGQERRTLEILAKEEGVAERVKFLGRRPHHELPGILGNAGVMVLPSVAEGFGMVLVEAQLAGLAVIGADAGGQREMIEHGRTGILVEPDDPHALACAIENLYNDEKETLRMARQGQETAKARFLAAPTAARLARIYKRILA